MKKTKLFSLMASIVLTTSVATAAELYSDPLAGSEALPAAIYGSITVNNASAGTTLTTDKIQTGLAVAETIAAGEFQFYTHTTAFWFKAGATPASDTLIYQVSALSGGGVGIDSFTLSRTTSDFLQLSIEGRAADTLTSSTALTPNTWHHIAVSVEDADGILTGSAPGTYTVFLNGIQVATKSGVNLRINGDTPGQVKFFNGLTYAGIYVDDAALDTTAIQTKATESLLNPELYANKLNDDVLLPTGTYGGITTTEKAVGSKLAGDLKASQIGVITITNGRTVPSDHTATFWYKTPAVLPTTSTAFYRVASTTGTQPYNEFNLKLKTDGKLELVNERATTGSGDTFTSTATLTTNTWYHLAVSTELKQEATWLGVLTVYLNGTSEIVSPETAFNMNGDPDGDAYWFGGQTYAGIYVDGRVLDQADIRSFATTSLHYDPTFTPAIGLEVVQTGTELTWTIEEEIGVKQYNITVDGVTTVVMFDAVANGSYSITLESDTPATLTVVDNSGLQQTFLPADGNLVKVAYDLNEGWNLIAMPGENTDTSEIGSQLWGWNGSAYELIETPVVGQAVWVYSISSKQVIVSADKVETELALNPGWNMVGPTVNMAIPEEAHTVYGYNDTYQDIATEDGVLLQGIGYWIFKLISN